MKPTICPCPDLHWMDPSNPTDLEPDMPREILTVTTKNGDPLEVVFEEAKTPERRRECYALAYTEFGAPLRLDEHVERDEHLSQRPLTAVPGGWNVWYLALADDQNSPVVATCKTIRRELLIREAGGKVREEEGYCVASVITDERFRGLGLASFLINKTAEFIDGPGGGVASVLYSSAGDFYVKHGWSMYSALQAEILACPSVSDVRRWLVGLPETRLLRRDDIPSLCARDVEGMKADMDRYQLPPSAILVANSPSASTINWQHDRCDFISLKVNEGHAPEIKGAISEDGETWAYWYHDFRKKQLAIQRIRIATTASPSSTIEETLISLLLHAWEEAVQWKLPKVVIWNPGPEVRLALEALTERGGAVSTLQERVGSDVPSLRWKRGDAGKEVIMVPNEFYAWA